MSTKSQSCEPLEDQQACAKVDTANTPRGVFFVALVKGNYPLVITFWVFYVLFCIILYIALVFMGDVYFDENFADSFVGSFPGFMIETVFWAFVLFAMIYAILV